jgi:hypothetical protein
VAAVIAIRPQGSVRVDGRADIGVGFRRRNEVDCGEIQR